ncbi:N-6 DNA methylase [Niastella sp. OAS944]|uniref:N-6 DNA methylase n=1 Tax=Niastella sp. OAS944 TaxID=2664089 RepID=UPI00347BD988|nr:type I restriction enzyme M protein [Chitinophagaceae bacterium OAS944]
MLDSATKKRIDDCRDILVGKLPDPKAQIEQITIGLIYKFMDDMDKESIELGGKAKFFANYKLPNPEFPSDRKKDIVVQFEQYSWDNLFNPKVTAIEMLRLYSEAIVSIEKNPNIPPLFRDIFKNAFLPYRDPETLKLFLKTIDGFEYTHSEKLGDAFEYLLSVMGSQGDAGQFRTPRHIIDFIVEVVNPTKTDKILDPACGTAGFLISAFKHIKEKNKNGFTPDERKKLMQNFVGYDISPDMVRLSLVNLYLHGFSDPHIWEYDTLSSEERWDETFDVILANPPFMSPKGGIRPHKKFSISSNRSEVLFVDYIAEHLNSRGRAGIIVPEGVIFQSGGAYKDLRKMLVNNYLYAVVSLPAGVFNPYSGVKTSILLMDKEFSKSSKEILFVKIDNDGFGLGAQRNPVKGGQLGHAAEVLHQYKNGDFSDSEIAHVVSKAEIGKNGEYNLSGEKYKSFNALSTNYESVKLGDVCKVVNGRAYKQEELLDRGKYPVLRVGNFFSNREWYYSDLELEADKYCSKGDLLYAWSASFGPKIWDGEKCIYHYHIWKMVPDEKKINKYFLYHVLNRETEAIKAEGGRGIAMIHITKAGIENREIPLPPLSIQEELVADIDDYQKIIDGAKAVIENYKPKIDIDPDWEIVKLGDVCDFIRGPFGGSLKKEIFVNEGYAVYEQSHAIYNQFQDFRYFIDESKFKEMKRFEIAPNDIIMSCSGTMGKVSVIPKTAPKGIINQALLKLTVKKGLLTEFLKLWMDSNSFQKTLLGNVQGAAIANVASVKVLKELEMPLPPIKIQNDIVSQIEKEQTLVNGNRKLIEIFEQKIKDRIAKVWGK